MRDGLDRYRGFRHVVCNIYSFEIDKGLIAPLLRDLPDVFASVRAELIGFADALHRGEPDVSSE